MTAAASPRQCAARDEKTDLAVLKIEAKKPLPAVQFGDSDQALVGDWVLAIGNPFGLGGTATSGIVSAGSRDIGAGPYDDFLQIEASINRGPVFDLSGRVIGIGFAIPSKLASQVVGQLIQSGRIERGWLGVEMQPMSADLAEAMGRDEPNGALVGNVVPDSPAERAGVHAGDVITGFNRAAIRSPRDLARAVAEAKPARAEFTIARDGRADAFGRYWPHAAGQDGVGRGNAGGTALGRPDWRRPRTADARAARGTRRRPAGRRCPGHDSGPARQPGGGGRPAAGRRARHRRREADQDTVGGGEGSARCGQCQVRCRGAGGAHR
jgi:hypothetical protein